ncbi:MAG: glycosyltransferase [Alphaproteobacteria bacterium]|nr:glycosyltransferase [Alphaproteobacteria bacterium]
MKSIKYWPIYRKFLGWANRKFPVIICKIRFRRTFGKKINLKCPKDINEKILWLSLYSDTSEWSRMADKFAVRSYVEGLGLGDYLVKLYGKWDSVEEIEWDKLPNQFVLKSNNGSGTVKLVTDKTKLDIPVITKILDTWLHKKVTSTTTEFHYHSIKPCIIAEELLDFSKDQNESTSAIDYKVWCFNGKAYYVWACANRDEEATDVALFDREWNYLPEKSVFNEHYREQKVLVKKPRNLELMLDVAEKLAKPFPVVRVDLYNINGRIYFGEMTFTSLGGTMDFYTQDCLLEMGSLIDISKVKKIK